MYGKTLKNSYFRMMITALSFTEGGGGGVSATHRESSVPSAISSANDNRLFVVDNGHHQLAAFSSSMPSAGAAFARNVLASDLQFHAGLAYDTSRDQLYATQGDWQRGDRISVFNNASGLKGNVEADRVIFPLVQGIQDIHQLYLDRATDTLYVSIETAGNATAGGVIAVFGNASSLNGNVMPDRWWGIDLPGMFAIDWKRNVLYTVGYGYECGPIRAYSDIDAKSGELGSDFKSISLSDRLGNAALGHIAGFAIDMERDRLYIGEAGSGIRILENASSARDLYATGECQPALQINLPNMDSSSYSIWAVDGVTYDARHDRLYAGFNNKVYVLDDVSRIDAQMNSVSATMVPAPEGALITAIAFP